MRTSLCGISGHPARCALRTGCPVGCAIPWLSRSTDSRVWYKSLRLPYVPPLVRSSVNLSLINRDVFQIHLAGVFGARADQFVVAELFEHMRGPAGNAADGENGRVKVNRDAEHVVCRG